MTSIAYINNHFPALSHTFIYNEVEGLRQRGVEIKTFSIRKPDRNSLSAECLEMYRTTIYLLPPKITQFIKAHLFYAARHMKTYVKIIHFLMTRDFENKIKDRIRTLCHFCEGVYFAQMIREDGTIVHIHAHYASHPATVAMVASGLTGIPFSFTAHAHDIWDDKLFLRDKVDRARFVITCSEYGKNAIAEIHGNVAMEKISTIYHGVDIAKFIPAEAPSRRTKFTILNIGRLCKEKAQDDLILACRHLRDEGYDFCCDIVGDGPLYQQLNALIEQNHLEGIVRLPGKVFQENIKDYYRAADLFVLSSVSENLPNVLLESLAMGVPVVATNIAGIPELIKNGSTGILVAPGNPAEMARTMKMLMDNRGMLQELSREGRKSVCRHFDAEKCLDKVSGLMSQSRAQASG